jgi:hypothetical protein
MLIILHDPPSTIDCSVLCRMSAAASVLVSWLLPERLLHMLLTLCCCLRCCHLSSAALHVQLQLSWVKWLLPERLFRHGFDSCCCLLCCFVFGVARAAATVLGEMAAT